MTYVSRRTRIIVSRWSDECNAEYILQACRRRSDGRLKNYTSCDDLRAWINDNCIKNEYLLDLMSKSEFLGKPPFALYGRFIPVPILFKLLEQSNEERRSSERRGKESIEKEASENLSRIQREKNQTEKNLLDCTWLLNTAIKKLEKLDNILESANSETEIIRARQIQDAFSKSKNACGCSECQSSSFSSLNNISDSYFTSNKRKSRDSATYNELMRKISQLKKKLKEVKACRYEIIHQIRKVEKCASSNQLTELFNWEDQDLIKKLQKELEKLVAEKGRLLSEMCHVLKSLNSLKTSSMGNVSSRKGNWNSDGNYEAPEECKGCKCGCKGFDNYESTDSENAEFSESAFGYNTKLRGMREEDCDFAERPDRLVAADYSDQEPEKLCNDVDIPVESTETQRICSNYAQNTLTPFQTSNQPPALNSSQEKAEKVKETGGKKKETKGKKAKLKFICDDPPSEKNIYAKDLSAYESSLTPEQRAVISKAVKSIQVRRPSTTPVTKRERRESSLKYEPPEDSSKPTAKDSLRKVKSEAMIKEFEKTLRNYERRLSNLDSLESKLENLRQKSAEVFRLKRKLAKVKAEAKKQRATDKEKFNSEITRLCSENWELKKHVQQLAAKSDAQNKKIQNLKCTVMKAKELECEAEELKKELSEYRDGFEHQRKCISKWESVVAMQRTEIENLMNHIRKLTAVKEETQCQPYQEKKYVQRSRSYSPEIGKEKSRNMKKKSFKEFRPMSEEEESGCCCEGYPYMENRKKTHLSRGCFTPSNGSMNWYK